MFNYIKERLHLANIDLDDKSIQILVKHATNHSEGINEHTEHFINACINLALAGTEDII